MSKYLLLFCSLISLTVLCWMLGATTQSILSPQKTAPVYQNNNPLDATALARMQGRILNFGQLLEHFEQVALQDRIAVSSPLALSVAPETTATTSSTTENSTAIISPPKPVLTNANDVTLVYLSGDLSRVSIGGILYAKGDQLPDGSEIIDISMSQITLSRHHQRRTLAVPKPHVVGSMHSPAHANKN